MPPLPLSPGVPGIPGGPLDPNDPTNFMRSILDAQNRQRIWDTMGGLATGLIRASAPSREPQDLFGSAVAGALEGDKGGEDRGLKRAMTSAQLMQATQKVADDKMWRDMFTGAQPGGDTVQNDRGGWPAMPAGGGAPAAPSAASPSPNPAGGGIAKALGDVQAGMPGLQLPVTSATRTPEQNRLVGGAPDSQHLHGNAYDISLKGFSDQQKQQIVTGFLAHPNVTGFGYYPESDSIHVDSRPGARMAWGADKTTATVGAGWPAWMTDAVGQWRGQAQPPGPVGGTPQAQPVQYSPPAGGPGAVPQPAPTGAKTIQQVLQTVPPAVRQIIGASGREKGLPLLMQYADPESVPAMDAVTGQVVFAPKTELGSGRYVPVDAARLGLEMRRENREAMNAKIVTGPDGKPAMNQPLYEFEKGIDAQRLELEKKKVPSEITRNESQNQNQPLLPDGRPNPAFIGTQGEIEAAKAKAAADAKMGVEAATALTTARVKDFEDNQRPKALAASQELNEIYQARQLLRAGAVTGTGAEARAWLENLKASVGWPSGQSVNTPAFVGAMANRVLGAIKTLGANPSNADRDYMEKAKGGSIAYSEQAIERLLEIGERAARQALATYNAEAGRMKKMRGVTEAFAPDHFDVAEPPPYEKWAQSNPLKAVTPQSLTPSAIDQEIERRRRGR